MIANGVDHVSFPVTDMARSREFYEGVLGLEEVERPNFPFDGAWYRVGASQVHLIVPPEGADVGAPPPGLNPVGPHAAFAVDDYDAVLAHLQAKDVTVFETSAEMGQMWIRDPDGNIIELIATRR